MHIPTMRFTHPIRLVLSAGILTVTTPWALPAQGVEPPAIAHPSDRMARRAELEAGASYYDRLAASPAYSERSRARARELAALARTRLREGDFRIGDRIFVVASGTSPLTDTVTVLDGGRISLVGYGPVSLVGVLRAELEAKLLSEMTAVVRNTLVTARPLMRVAVFGAVTRPGYYNVPQEVSLDEVLSRAGGPLATADVRKTELTRADTVLLSASALGEAIARGTTLDALGVQDGDALMVPVAPLPWDRNTGLQLVSMFVMPIVMIYVLR